MNEDRESSELFPDLDAAEALRAGFRRRGASSDDALHRAGASDVSTRRATVSDDASHRAGASDGASSAAPSSSERDGYELRGEIARGGMGVVIKAFDRELTRDVALKLLREELAREPRMVRRFLAEARVTARLDHPGIVPVHRVGAAFDGRAYFAMRLVRGRDLRKIMELANSEREGWSRTRALSVFLKVCEAMAYAHDKGVIHRDLKPSNVMVGEFGEVYVMDWGLARVIGDADPHDLRLSDELGAPASGTTQSSATIASAGDVTRVADSDSPLVTADGEVLGTPCYMSPEQARGRLAELGPRSDVYSVGAMLYQLLANAAPYVPAGTSAASRAVLARVVAGPPQPLHASAREIPAELLAICERAMARDPEARYASMLEMAEDLRAFLERRVVRAYETGAWAEAKNWVRRNRAFATACATALLVLVCGLVASLVLRAQSERNAVLAQANADTARANAATARENQQHAEAEKLRAETNEALATARADDVFRLSALQDLDDLVAEARELWPAEPATIPRYEAWIARAEKVAGELPAHEKKLAELRERSIPWSGEQVAAARARHPRLAELARLERELDTREKLRAAMISKRATPEPGARELGIDAEALPSSARESAALARPLVDPQRTEWGGEARGLFLARRAVDAARSLAPSERAEFREVLAWALLANGRVDDAMVEGQRALEEAGAERAREFEPRLAALQSSIDASLSPEGLEKENDRIVALASRVEELDVEISRPRERSFADSHDRWWHEQLVKLVDGLKAFVDPKTGLCSSGVSHEHGWGVQKRLAFARTIEARSVTGPDAAALWSEAMASIGDANRCPLYRGVAITPQRGLVPIGRDPESGAWEFAHLATGEPPRRGADGQLVLRDDMGLVFVLLPGGTFRMGAQRTDPRAPNFDAQALDNEAPVHEESIAPFFIAKYEMTQGQWQRFTGRNPSLHGPAFFGAAWSRDHRAWSPLHPVENVNWFDSRDALARAGLDLPTEAEWEYACRAGTSTRYWTGDDPESLRGAANLSDAYGKTHGNDSWQFWEPWLDDGETLHGEIGSYRANAFGLHDVHGNVFEWCKSAYFDYGKQAPVETGIADPSINRIVRGGSFGGVAASARSAFRDPVGAGSAAIDLFGLRPVRRISP